jgi:hypothetical protein
MQIPRSAILVILAVFGCSTYHPKVRYIEEEYAPYAKDGTSVVSGRAFLTLESGEVKTGAAQTVYAVPVTSRSTQAFERGIVRNRPVEPDAEPMSETVKKAKRTAQADDEGKFRFERLPAGDYYVYCQIPYTLKASDNRTTLSMIGVAYSKVTLAENEEKSVTVTR